MKINAADPVGRYAALVSRPNNYHRPRDGVGKSGLQPDVEVNIITADIPAHARMNRGGVLHVRWPAMPVRRIYPVFIPGTATVNLHRTDWPAACQRKRGRCGITIDH